MITEWVLKFLMLIAHGLLSLLPGLTLPSWVDSISSELTNALSLASQFGNWVPVQAIALVATFILTCYAVALSIRVARMVASFFTGGGGSAA